MSAVPEIWTTLKVLEWTAKRFAERGLETPRLDAEVLLAHTLSTKRIMLYAGFDKPLSPDELARYKELIRRRLGGEPVAYLIGTQEFWSLPLAVDARVLVPRRDTETLVEVAIAATRARAAGALHVLDLCTGSGAVALALASELADARVVATDVSAEALAVAIANANALSLAERISFHQGDLFAALRQVDEPFDLIVSNPPYVPAGDIAGLSAEVRAEPRLALDGGADGLDIVRRLVAAAPARLRAGGSLALEHGHDQGAAVRALLEGAGFVDVRTVADLAGLDRVSVGRRP